MLSVSFSVRTHLSSWLCFQLFSKQSTGRGLFRYSLDADCSVIGSQRLQACTS